MGGAASATAEARATMSTMLTNKPLDASDINDVEQGKAEIRQLRKIALQLRSQLQKADTKAEDKGKKRGAVMDNAKMGGDNDTPYVAKVIEKSAKMREMLLSIVAANVLFSSYTYEEHAAIVDAFEMKTVGAD